MCEMFVSARSAGRQVAYAMVWHDLVGQAPVRFVDISIDSPTCGRWQDQDKSRGDGK